MSARHISSWWLSVLIIILIAGFGYVLTQARKSEEEMVAAIHRAEQWKVIIDDSETAYIVITPEEEIVLWNDGAQSLFGWTKSEMVGTSVEILIPEDRTKKHHDGMNNKEATNKLQKGGVLQVTGYMQRRNGSLIKVQIRLVAVINGSIHYVAQIVHASSVEILPEVDPPSKLQYIPKSLDDFKKK